MIMYSLEQLPSEMIKYTGNCWLASQVLYWDEIKKLCDKLKIDPQMLLNSATLDTRINKYGLSIIWEQYIGFYFQKNVKSLITSFENPKINSIFLAAVEKTNAATDVL